MDRNLTPLLLLATTALCAQPTITQLSMNIGDQVTIDAYFPITAPGPGGNNVTWDFSSPGFSGGEWTYTAQTVASTPVASDYPGATIALYGELDNDFSGYFFLDFNNGFTEHGEWITDGVDAYNDIHSDPHTFFTTPLTMGSAGSDTYASEMEAFGALFTTVGSHTWTVDGYGTLILPNATHTNVLRVHSLAVDVNTVIIGGFPISTTMDRERWWWFKQGVPFPLLAFSLEDDGFETAISETAALVAFGPFTGTDEIAPIPMRVYPNPVRDVVTMELEASGTVQYRVLDALGREVLHGSMAAGGTLRHSIDVAGLTAGPYHLEVRTAEGLHVARLVKE